MIDACQLQNRRVQTTSGRLLGHVHDLRCERRGTGAVLTHLIYGRRGLLERLGFREPSRDTLPWSRIVEINDRAIIVMDGPS